jgi:hypothetical protein
VDRDRQWALTTHIGVAAGFLSYLACSAALGWPGGVFGALVGATAFIVMGEAISAALRWRMRAHDKREEQAGDRA